MQSNRVFRIVVTTLLCGVVGCQPTEDPVVTYSVPKHDSIQIPIETPKNTPAADPSEPTSAPQSRGRMLAALILDNDVSWSLKALASPDEFPSSAAEDFEQLVKTLKFEDPQKPTWELSEKWEERPGSGMRAANLMLGGLEFSVIKLPMREANTQKYILDNVNRWRGQVGLSPVSIDELPSSVKTLQTQDGHEATVLDLVGMQSGSAGRRPPPTRTAESSLPFTDRPPADWQPAKAGPMQLTTYVLESNGSSAKVSVSKAGGAVLPNINRWRGQVGLAPLGELAEAVTEDIAVSGTPGILAEIYGETGQSIVVAMLPADSPTWFFKLQGDTDLVKKSSASFREYLKTVQLQQ